MRSKFLNKKWLVLLMAVMLIVLSITGCGGKDDDDDDDDRDSKSKKELSIDKDDEDDEDEDDDKKDKDDDDVEATPEPTAEPTPEPTEEPTVEEDWETAYEGYFDTLPEFINENMVTIVSTEEDGVYMEMAYGYSEQYSAFSLEVDEAYFELITDPERMYYYSESGDDYTYAQCVREDDSSADIMGMAENMKDMVSDIEYDYYLGEEEYEGIYDVVACTVDYSGEECEGYAYINRETQVMELLEIEDSDGNYMDIEIIDTGKDGFMEMVEDTIADYEGVDEVTFEEMGNMVLDFLVTQMEGALEGGQDNPVVDDGNTGAAIEGDDWSTAYDDFFDNGLTIPETFVITTQMDLGGILLNYEIAQDAEISLVRYRIGDYGVDAYTINNTIIMENIGLNGSEWVGASIESGDDVAEILGADFTELMGGVTDSVSSATYVEAVEENGVVYDVMEIDTEGTPARVFINRETQTVSQMILEEDGLVMVCTFEGVSSIEIPDGLYTAAEMTKDELAAYYQDAIVESVYASMGMEY